MSSVKEQMRLQLNSLLGLVTLANDTLAQGFGTTMNVKLTVTNNRTLTTTVPAPGNRCTLMVVSSGVSPYTITFGTGFKTTGTLSTGSVDAKTFLINFLSDGTNLYELSRTVAI